MADELPPAPIAVQVFYPDVAAAVAWLCRAFGFTERWRLEPAGTLLMANLGTPGGGGVMISGLPDEHAAPAPTPNPWYSITVMVPDVDAHFTAATAAGATIVAEPTDQPWGFRDYEAVDLEGRQWNFSQVLHAAAPEDWGATGTSPSG